MVALPCWPFEISPLNELYSGKLVRSITLIPYENFYGHSPIIPLKNCPYIT